MTATHFDVIIVADFRFQGGTSSAVAAEIAALKRGGHSVALYQMNAPMLTSLHRWNERIQALVEESDVVVLPAETVAKCNVLLIHSPWLFVEATRKRPQIKAALRILIAHHAPTNANGRLNYDPFVVHRHATRCFGGPIVWAPISPVCRATFDRAGMTQPRLRDDWTNVVDVDEWGDARSRLIADQPIVGRHSRPQINKWPATREDMLKAYPADADISVKLLGAGPEVRRLIEPVPQNWTVLDFNEVPVRQFLGEIDFFVYYHHPDLVETFGLTIAEAAAAGCVVITHPYLEATFGKAALYSPPDQAPELVRAIARDQRRYATLSAQGRESIRLLCGPDGYLTRFRRLLAASKDPEGFGDLVVGPETTLWFKIRGCPKRSAYWWRHRLIPRVQALRERKFARRFARKIKKIRNAVHHADLK